MLRYYALRVAPQKEFIVQRQLNQQEIPALVPREYKWRRVSAKGGRRVKKAYPLFARYVFAGFQDLTAELRRLKIEEIQGVVCRTRREWSPLALSVSDLAVVQQLAGTDTAGATLEIHKALKPGGEARIIRGSFAGATVKIDKVTTTKAKVLLNILNSLHVVSIPIEALDAA